MDLTSYQKEVLAEFRERVGEKVPTHMSTDFELAKWLVARDFNIEKSEAMLLKSLDWREDWKLDRVLRWNPPEVLLKYYTVGFSGYDNDGAPVLVIPFGRIDIRGLFQSCRIDDFIRFTLQVLEKSLKDMRDKSVGLEVPIQKENFIFDVEHFSLRDFTWRPALETVLKLVQMYEANYPEILKCAYVINAPYLFSIAYNFVKPFLHERTVNRIKIFGRTGWKEVLLESISADQIPVHWGGTMTDPDGNTMCVSKICMGGKIPEIYYLENVNTDEYVKTTPDNLDKLIVPKKEKKVLEFEVDIPGTKMRWEIKAVEPDVEFGIFRASSSGKEEEIISMQKLNTRITSEEGSIVCVDPGTYKMIFDNETGNQSKQIYYEVEISPPEEHTKF